MIDLGSIRYDLVLTTQDGRNYHLFEARKSLSWEEPPGELSVRLTAGFQNRQVDGKWLNELLPIGAWVYLYSDWGNGWKEIFRGNVWGTSNPNQMGEFSITAYDMLKYLKSKDDRFYPAGTSAKTMIQDITGAWSIPLSIIDGPYIAMPRKRFARMEISAMLLEILAEAKDKGAGKFIMRSREGLAEIVRPGQNSPVFHFGAGQITGNIEDTSDIEDLVTRMKIIGSEDNDTRAPVIETIDGSTGFGIIQEIVVKEKQSTSGEARAEALQILKEKGKPRRQVSVPAPDLPFLRRGDKVHITAAALDGYFIVAGVKHDADAQTMQMEVETDE